VLVRVIVDVRVCPAEPVGEVTAIVKSPTWTVMVTEWDAVPVAAVAVRVALCKPEVDDEIVHVEVAVPLAARVALVHVIERPEPTPATLTVPAKF